MAKIILYSNDCPRCQVLKKKLNGANIQYEISNNFDFLLEKGIESVPVLVVDNEIFDFKKAVEWVNGQGA